MIQHESKMYFRHISTQNSFHVLFPRRLLKDMFSNRRSKLQKRKTRYPRNQKDNTEDAWISSPCRLPFPHLVDCHFLWIITRQQDSAATSTYLFTESLNYKLHIEYLKTGVWNSDKFQSRKNSHEGFNSLSESCFFLIEKE